MKSLARELFASPPFRVVSLLTTTTLVKKASAIVERAEDSKGVRELKGELLIIYF